LKVPFSKLGKVHGKNILIDGNEFGQINEFKTKYDTSIENHFQ